jgi:hypothetical protein
MQYYKRRTCKNLIIFDETVQTGYCNLDFHQCYLLKQPKFILSWLYKSRETIDFRILQPYTLNHEQDALEKARDR